MITRIMFSISALGAGLNLGAWQDSMTFGFGVAFVLFALGFLVRYSKEY